MSADLNTAPQALADVKAGDVVAVCCGGSRELATVDRVTATQIVCGHRRFRVADGYRAGGSDLYQREHISLDRKSIATAKKNAAASTLRAAAILLDQGAVLSARAACDAAETALREVGEWTDE